MATEKSRRRLVLTNLMLICAVLYQFGPSYHLSFGSVGLALLLVSCKGNASRQSAIVAGCVGASCFVSYLLNVIEYGDSGNMLRVARLAFNGAALFLILNRRGYVQPPSEWLVGLLVVMLSGLCAYQNFVDLGFRPPGTWYALEKELGGDVGYSDYRPSVFRVSGLYSEPSEFGMILCLLMALCLRMKARSKLFLLPLCSIAIVLTGSLLGLVGMMAIAFSSVRSGRQRWQLAIAVSAVVGMLLLVSSISESGFAVFQRSYSGGGQLDDSTMTRLIYPFVLIYYNFRNLDVFGFPGDIYGHFLYTGLYDSLSSFPGHNGFLGLVLTFGLFGVVEIWFLFMNLVRLEEVVLVILIGSQSGNFYSYEKVFLMLFAVFLVRGLARSRADVPSLARGVAI